MLFLFFEYFEIYFQTIGSYASGAELDFRCNNLYYKAEGVDVSII
jgi:hypothetical protein